MDYEDDDLDVIEMPRAFAETEDGVNAAEKGANPEWIIAANTCLRDIAKSQEYFTAAEVSMAIRKRFPEVKTRTNRALGPVIYRAAKDDMIESTGEFTTDKLRSWCHNVPVRIWKSRLYEAAHA